jgi:acetyl-CoA C-acetyltransferase
MPDLVTVVRLFEHLFDTRNTFRKGRRFMSIKDVFVVGTARTAVGSFQGQFSSTPAVRLGATAIRAAVERAGVKPADVQRCYMGNVLNAAEGQAPARQACIYAELPTSVPCITVSKVCGSGMEAIIMGARTLMLGDADVVVAGGMENMTMTPYAIPAARSGLRMNDGVIKDLMVFDGLWDPYGDQHMGMFAEKCAEKYGFTREMQDQFAMLSYERALAAIADGTFKKEIVAVQVPKPKGDPLVIDEDEEPKKYAKDKVSKLRPAFKKDGTVTAVNASSINDGAAAVVLASAKAVKQHGLKPLARLVSYGGHAQAPEWFTTAPVGASRSALERAGVKSKDVDYWEVNEAFAVVAMAAERDLEIPRDRLNIHGSGCSIGHPIGCTGARIVVTLLSVLKEKQAARGLATLCIGGGEGLATVWERV